MSCSHSRLQRRGHPLTSFPNSAVISLAVGKALLTFVPAFLLSQLIRSLEGSDVVDRHPLLWLCAGLAASEAAIGVLASHAT